MSNLWEYLTVLRHFDVERVWTCWLVAIVFPCLNLEDYLGKSFCEWGLNRYILFLFCLKQLLNSLWQLGSCYFGFLFNFCYDLCLIILPFHSLLFCSLLANFYNMINKEQQHIVYCCIVVHCAFSTLFKNDSNCALLLLKRDDHPIIYSHFFSLLHLLRALSTFVCSFDL